MEIRFLEIKLHNFASFKDATLDLNEMGNTLVTGRNNCKLDNAYSNGSGKSSIFNGLCYALTGETAQGISTGIENIFSDPEDCWVELLMMIDDDQFRIRRIKSPKQNLKIYINGEDCSGKGIRESSQLLETYIPDLTSELVSSVIILGQGLPHRFTNNKPSHRKELLEKLTKSDFMIQSIKDKLEERQNEIRQLVRIQEDILIGYNSQIEVYNNNLSKLNTELNKFDKDLTEDELDQKINNINIELATIDSSIINLSDRLTEVELKVDDLTKTKNTILLEKDTEVNSRIASIEEDIVKYNKEYIEITAEIKSLEKEIKKLDSITDICPTCGQKIPEVNKPDTSKQHQYLDESKISQSSLKNKLDGLNKDKSDTIIKCNQEYADKVSTIDGDISNLGKEVKLIQNEISTLTQNKNSLSLKVVELTNQKLNYTKVLDDIRDVENSIENLNKSTGDVNVEMTRLRSHLDMVQQLMTLAKREFRGVLLANVIAFLDKKMKQYSMEVFGTEQLAFTLNENYIDITYCDKLYENLSGGERQKIDVIIQLALRDILSKQLNIHSNLLVLDEIYDNMDSISCQKITNLVSNLSDIDSIFIISHHAQDLEITYDNNLQVEKDGNGISTLSFV